MTSHVGNLEQNVRIALNPAKRAAAVHALQPRVALAIALEGVALRMGHVSSMPSKMPERVALAGNRVAIACLAGIPPAGA